MAAPTALAQWTPSASGSTTAAAEINGKVNYQSGSGAPSVNCTAGKDLYFDLTNFQSYWCKATNTWAAFAGVVTSVFGRTAAVVAGSGDYTTAQVTESGNLYFTAGRAQAAMAGLYQTPISGAPGTWPTLGTAASHAASDFQAALTAYSTISGLSGYPSTFPAAITLTTSGSSGASTWNGTTLNIPQYSGGGGGGAPSPGITNHVYVSDGAGGWTDTGCTWNPSTGLVSCPSTNPLLVAGTCQAASAVSPPTSGVAAFCDSGNSNHLSVKPYGGSVVDLQATAGMSGVLKYASGSPSPIGTSSTNCVHEDGSSGSCGGGGGYTMSANHGFWFPMGDPSPVGSIANGTTAAHVQYSREFCTDNARTFNRWGFEVQTASGSGTGLRFAIWSDDGSTKLWDSGVLTAGGSPDINTTGEKVLSIGTPVSLAAGCYYFSYTSDSSALAIWTYQGSDSYHIGINVAWTFGAGNFMTVGRVGRATASTGSGSSLAFPSTRGAVAWASDDWNIWPIILTWVE